MQDIVRVIITWIYCVLGVERVVEIVNTSKLFEPIRQYLGRKVANDQSRIYWFWWFFHGVITCSWCLSVWMCLAATFLIPQLWVESNTTISVGLFLAKWFAMIGLVNRWHDITECFYRYKVVVVDRSFKDVLVGPNEPGVEIPVSVSPVVKQKAE